MRGERKIKRERENNLLNISEVASDWHNFSATASALDTILLRIMSTPRLVFKRVNGLAFNSVRTSAVQ